VLHEGRSDFDTLAWYTGRLVIGVFDDDVPGGPVMTIEIKGPSIHELTKEAA
jgi:serine/threonine protein phosphatase 1